MADDQLRLKATFDDKASSGVKKLGKDLAGVKPTHGMAQAQKWFAEFRGTVGQTEKLVKPISGYMGAIGVTGLAASLSIGEMVKQFKELASQTLALKEIGRQTGLTTTEVKRLRYAASELSIDPDKMVAGLQVMSDKMADFHRGASELNGLLNNFDPDFSRKLMGDKDDPQKELKDIVDWLAQIPAKQRAAGKSAADAAQAQKRWTEAFFGDGSLARLAATPGEFAAAMADAAKSVPEVTKAMEEQAKLLNKSVLNLNQSWEKLKNELGPSVIDPMVQTIDKLDAAFKQLNGIVTSPAPEKVPPRKPDGTAGESAGEYLGRTFRNSLRATFQGNEIAADGQWLWDHLFGISQAQAKEAPPQYQLPHAPANSGFPLIDDDRRTRARPGEFSWVKNTDGNALHRHDDEMSAVTAQELFRSLPAASGSHPDDDRQTRARSSDFARALNTDGNALRRNDDALSPVTAQELFQKVREGSKEGIVQGLREMAQEQELAGGGGPTANAGGGANLGHGAPDLRYGRRSASGAYRGTPIPDAPYNGKNIDGLTEAGTKQYASILGQRESGNRYGITNPYGYVGRWQMGAAALAENGYVRPGTSNAGLRDPSVWTGKGGIHSLDEFKANKGGIQDTEFGEYTNRHYAQLKAAGVIRPGMSQAEIAGWLAAAHLKGVGGAISLARGHDNVDANGTSASSYRRMMQGVGAGAPTAGGGAPAPSSAAQTAADAFKARLKALQGAPPQAHASGGPIRGPGGPRSDSIFAMLSNGEFVVNARDAQRHAGLLQAINSGGLPAYADGGFVRRRSWLDFFHRSMGASRPVALGATAMMMGESGRNLNPSIYGWDVNGPSGGTAQWHDVTKGPGAGRVHRLSDMMTLAMQQHVDWKDMTLQQAWWKHEATGPLAYAWNAMRHAKTAAGALKAGIDKFEVPADKLGELHKRLPNIIRLAQEAGGGAGAREIDPIDIHFHHHQDGRVKSIRTKTGRGVRVHLARGPTFAAASETD